jgi:hypothetical protein
MFSFVLYYVRVLNFENIFLPAGATDFSVLQRVYTGPASSQPSIQWVLGALSPAVKRPGRETGHSYTTSAKIKNGRGVPLLPNMSYWRGVTNYAQSSLPFIFMSTLARLATCYLRV